MYSTRVRSCATTAHQAINVPTHSLQLPMSVVLAPITMAPRIIAHRAQVASTVHQRQNLEAHAQLAPTPLEAPLNALFVRMVTHARPHLPAVAVDPNTHLLVPLRALVAPRAMVAPPVPLSHAPPAATTMVAQIRAQHAALANTVTILPQVTEMPRLVLQAFTQREAPSSAFSAHLARPARAVTSPPAATMESTPLPGKPPAPPTTKEPRRTMV